MIFNIFLPLLFQLVSSDVAGNLINHGNPITYSFSGDVSHLLQNEEKNLPTDIYLNQQELKWILSPNKTHWNTFYEKSGEDFTKTQKEDDDVAFERYANAVTSLEITKSVELKFDPKTQAFVPVSETVKDDKSKAYESALLLLSLNTYKKLKSIFDKYEKEVKMDLADVKNFQTGRFKAKYYKNIQRTGMQVG